MHVNFYKIAYVNFITYPTPCCQSEPRMIISGDYITRLVDEIQTNIWHQIENFETARSEWVLHSVFAFELDSIWFKIKQLFSKLLGKLLGHYSVKTAVSKLKI